MNASSEAPVTSHPSPVTIQQIPLAWLRESPLNTRKTFDPVKLKELADSIREKGILTPLFVRYRKPAKEDPAGELNEILAGARRFRAAKLAGLVSVPCIVSATMDDSAALEIITMENLQREDLSALEEAQGFKALLDLGKYTIEELAKRLGKSASYVYQRVKLTELSPVAAKALTDQKITPGHAILIARQEPEIQAKAVQEIQAPYRDGEMSVRSLDSWLSYTVRDKKRQEELKKNPPPAPSGNSSTGSANKRSPAEKARDRKLRAFAAARIEGLRQIVAKAKQVDIEALAVKLCERTTFDARKLACQALGIWPKDGKTGNFNFNGKLVARVAALKAGTPEMAQTLLALSLAPSFGRWGNEYYGAKDEIAALHRAGKAAGVDVAKLERDALAAANAKAEHAKQPAAKLPTKAATHRPKGARKAKLHTSAKPKPKAKKAKTTPR